MIVVVVVSNNEWQWLMRKIETEHDAMEKKESGLAGHAYLTSANTLSPANIDAWRRLNARLSRERVLYVI